VNEVSADRSLRARLSQGVVVLDAGLGARLIERGLEPGRDEAALWNLSHPEWIEELHALDVESGAEGLVANTFGANRVALGRQGRGGEFESINRAAVRIARGVLGRQGYVLGSIGPTAVLQPGAARDQAACLLDLGVDALLLETFTDENIGLAVDELGSLDVPAVIASLWRWPDEPAGLIAALLERGVLAVGMNCASLPQSLAFARRVRERAPGTPLLIKPGVLAPGAESSPRAFAGAAAELAACGARLLGGCCGTSHEHVQALCGALPRSRTL